ncbi:MAG: tRNA (N6-threonylcarbamoyladenosine(37)-N6)-methyltransferase TrmO [Bdellovibrionales bacterium]|nr:tRNA (N6-threonylcarbamoyladenosine(37)-N6)-methyltransferase TrmO [Bdellovibrionales bacterium]
MKVQYKRIGTIQSDFREKFGVPRQSLMVEDARAILKLEPDPLYRTALQHLETFSHIWVIFEFHRHLQKEWTPTIRPPRLDAPNRVGVFASRSPDRPSPIGISAVKLDKIDYDSNGGIELHLSGVDLLDGTPVIDIKPYLPYADSIPDASSGWAGSEIPKFAVTFADGISDPPARPGFLKLVSQILRWDPRPTSQREAMPISDSIHEGKEFAFRISDYDVRWKIQNGAIHVLRLDVI